MARLQFKVRKISIYPSEATCDSGIKAEVAYRFYYQIKKIISFFSELSNQYYDTRTLRKVCGLLGTIKLISGKYLVVATHREFVGVIDNQVIWRLAGHDLIPYIPSLIHLSENQVGFFCSLKQFTMCNFPCLNLLLPIHAFFAENPK